MAKRKKKKEVVVEDFTTPTYQTGKGTEVTSLTPEPMELITEDILFEEAPVVKEEVIEAPVVEEEPVVVEEPVVELGDIYIKVNTKKKQFAKIQDKKKLATVLDGGKYRLETGEVLLEEDVRVL